MQLCQLHAAKRSLVVGRGREGNCTILSPVTIREPSPQPPRCSYKIISRSENSYYYFVYGQWLLSFSDSHHGLPASQPQGEETREGEVDT